MVKKSIAWRFDVIRFDCTNLLEKSGGPIWSAYLLDIGCDPGVAAARLLLVPSPGAMFDLPLTLVFGHPHVVAIPARHFSFTTDLFWECDRNACTLADAGFTDETASGISLGLFVVDFIVSREKNIASDFAYRDGRIVRFDDLYPGCNSYLSAKGGELPF
jgi:hypothetical protein